MKHFLVFALLFAQSIFPNEDPNTVEEPITNPITVSQTEYSIEEYSSTNISYTLAAGVDAVVTFASSNTDVATVNDLGVVSALREGEATITITAKVGEASFDTPVKVKVYSVTGTIDFKYNNVYVHRGTSYQLEYTLSNPLLQNKDIVWISDNPEVVEVENGVVKGVSKGSATITATIGDISASIGVDVIVPLQEIAFNPETITITLEDSVELPEIIYVPYDTSGRTEPSYHIEDESIVSFADGLLVGKKIGKTKVFARIDDIETELHVEVIPKVNEEGSTIVTLLPTEETDKHVKFVFSDDANRSNKRVALSLDSEAMKEAVVSKKTVIVNIPERYFEEDMRLIEGITIPKDAMEGFKGNTTIQLENDKSKTKIQYVIQDELKEDFNLKYRIQRISNTSPFAKQVDGRAFEIRFYTENPAGNIKGYLNAKDIDSTPQQHHFLYVIDDSNKLSEVVQNTKVRDDGTLEINVEDNHYLLTFNAVAKSSDQGIIWFLFGVVAVLGVGVGTIYYKRKGKSKKDVL